MESFRFIVHQRQGASHKREQIFRVNRLFDSLSFNLLEALHPQHCVMEMYLRVVRGALFQFIQPIEEQLRIFQCLNGPVHDSLAFFGIGKFF